VPLRHVPVIARNKQVGRLAGGGKTFIVRICYTWILGIWKTLESQMIPGLNYAASTDFRNKHSEFFFAKIIIANKMYRG
jgi:hypothetical protein